MCEGQLAVVKIQPNEINGLTFGNVIQVHVSNEHNLCAPAFAVAPHMLCNSCESSGLLNYVTD